MSSFEVSSVVSSEEAKDQEREKVVEKVRTYFEQKLAVFAANDAKYGSERGDERFKEGEPIKGWRLRDDDWEEKKLQYVAESFQSNDYTPAFLYFENEIKRFQDEIELVERFQDDEDMPEGWESEEIKYFKGKIAEIQALKDSLIIED
jgi:hypothetical protein